MVDSDVLYSRAARAGCKRFGVIKEMDRILKGKSPPPKVVHPLKSSRSHRDLLRKTTMDSLLTLKKEEKPVEGVEPASETSPFLSQSRDSYYKMQVQST